MDYEILDELRDAGISREWIDKIETALEDAYENGHLEGYDEGYDDAQEEYR